MRERSDVELEGQVERGELFTHTALSRLATRINEVEGFVYGLIDVLAERGVISSDELREAVRGVLHEARVMKEAIHPGIALRTDPDEHAPPRHVNCAERLHVCKAVCCRLDFALSKEEIEAGVARWDLGRPYFIRRDAHGNCHHRDPTTGHCGIYAQRPGVCQRYSCEGDARIWSNFEKMELNHTWLAEHLRVGSERGVELGAASSRPAMNEE